MQNRFIRLAAAAVSAMAVTSLGLAPAYAAPTPVPNPTVPPGAPAANPALINPAAKTSLTLTKYEGAPVNAPNDGTQQTITGRTPLAGVTYRVTKVAGVDLTTNAGWDAAKTYYASVPGRVPPLDTAVQYEGTTAANGTVVFSGLPVGLYYAEEIAAPAGGYTKAAPFLVTLPMTNPTNPTSWMYNVHAYPKNTLDTVSKAVVDQGTQTSASATGPAARHGLTYTVTSTITDGLTGAQMGMYVINDNLDPRLDLSAVKVGLSNGAALTRCTSDVVLSSTSCDYKVFAGPDAGPLAFQGADAIVAGGPKVSIVFTDGGLANLATNSTANVLTTLSTLANASATGNGIIPNTAGVIPNAAWWDQNKGSNTGNPENPGTDTPGDTPPGLPTNQVVSKYGDFGIVKKDAQSGSVLAGTEFTVYRGALGGDLAQACGGALDASTQLGTFTTGADGVGTFAGLQLSNFYNNADQATLQHYCLVETKAAAGYNLLARPIPFDITTPGVMAAASYIQVLNEKSNLANSLPLTGGAGVAVMGGLGLLLVGSGVAYYLFTSRREDQRA